MKRFIEYLEDSGQIINVFVYDGESDYSVPSGSAIKELEEDSQVGIDWTINEDGSFTEPPVATYAIYKKLSPHQEVIQVIQHQGFGRFDLPESQQLEYAAHPCGEEVQVGWRWFMGSFIPMTNEELQ